MPSLRHLLNAHSCLPFVLRGEHSRLRFLSRWSRCTLLTSAGVEASAVLSYVFLAQLAGFNQWASALHMEMSMTQVRKLVSKKELKTIHGIPYSFAHIARLEKVDQFPKRLLLGACRVAWWEDEIEEWKASRPRAA